MSSQPFSTRSTTTKRVSLLSKYLGVGLAVASLLAPVAHAATSTTAGQATLLLSPETGTFAVGEKVTMQVLLDTKGLEVSQVDFKLQYDPSYLEVQDSDLTKTGLQIKDGDLFEVLLSSSPVNTTTGMIQYSKLALSESKYYKTTGTPGKVATIDFKALKAGSTELAFQTTDGVSTKVYRATDDSQVLGEVTNADISITASGTSSATASASPSVSATPTMSASSTATVTPSAVPTAKRLNMALALNKNTLQADGNDKATLQATVKDQNGQPAANTKVVFGLTGNAVLGALSAMTNASGVASTTITAGTQAGNVTVSANLESDPTVSGSVQMTLAARPAATPSATARPTAAPMATGAPEVIAAPDHLNQVGPESTMAMTVLVSMLLAALALTAPRLAKEIVRK